MQGTEIYRPGGGGTSRRFPEVMSDESYNDGLPRSFASALSDMPPEREAFFLSVLSHNVTVAVTCLK